MSQLATKLKGLIWLVLFILGGIALSIPLLNLQFYIPWSWEKKLASSINVQPNHECVLQPQAKKTFEKIISRIYPVYPNDKKYTVKIIIAKNPIINAYAQLGGFITVNSGLIAHAHSADELAGVLAHEIEHIHHRHILESIIHRLLTTGIIHLVFSSSGASKAYWANHMLNIHFTRDEETQADQSALERLQRAGVSNKGLQTFFKRMQKDHSNSSFLSDHPSDASRLAMSLSYNNNDTQPVLSKEQWKYFKTQVQSCVRQ